MLEKNKYSCNEHIDIAFDDFLVEHETFPRLEAVTNKNCSYCNKEAVYVLCLKDTD